MYNEGEGGLYMNCMLVRLKSVYNKLVLDLVDKALATNKSFYNTSRKSGKLKLKNVLNK